MIFKTEQELREVISLGKPEEVIDAFLESYLQGLEFDKWKTDKDLEETEEIVVGKDEDGNDIFETRFINIYQAVNVSEQMADWKLDNYVLLRKYKYAPMEEQLDMQFKDKLNGTTTWEDHVAYIKSLIPKRVL